MSITLRPYQQDAVQAIHAALAEKRSTLLVLPTGCGKTIVFCDVVKDYVKRGKRVLVLAHRTELLDQAAAKLGQVGIINVAIERGQHRSNGESVVVASVATLRGQRLTRIRPEAFGLIVIDEAHRGPAAGHRNIVRHFRRAKVLGVTATPDRLDGKALGQLFDSVAYQYSIQEAIRSGYLVPIKSQRILVKGLDLARVRTRAGDLHRAELGEVLRAEDKLHRVAAPLVELAGDRRTVVFTVDVAHAEAMAGVINRYRPDSARWLSGKATEKKRRAMLDAYRAGEFQYLVNCALLTEGWDEPGVSCIALARPTKSRALYAQMVGRGTRLHQGKSDLLVLDFVGNTGKHRLISTADVLAGKVADDAVANAAGLLTGTGDDIHDLDALEMAQLFLAADEQRDQVIAVANFIAAEIDPFMPPPLPEDAPWSADPENQLDLPLSAGNPASDAQLTMLDKHGIEPPPGITSGQASRIIAAIVTRQKRGLCTYKQYRFLRRQGHTDPGSLSKAEAGRLISLTIAGRQGWARRAAQ